jgi:8-oxo-dGTP pyrophosphatase MutT (NUDIX family)
VELGGSSATFKPYDHNPEESNMPISDYLSQLRAKVGSDVLVLPSAAVAVFDERKRLLLGLHADRNIWVLPGGLIEPGELPADAALREAWEETGLHVELTGILGVYGGPDLFVSYTNGDRAFYIATVFRGRIASGDARPDGSEILDLKYFSEEELRQTPHSRWMDRAFSTLFGDSFASDFQPPSWRP